MSDIITSGISILLQHLNNRIGSSQGISASLLPQISERRHKMAEKRRNKRANGRGSISRYRGGRWRAFILMPNDVRESKIFDTKREAEDWLDEKRNQARQIKKVNLKGVSPTLSEYLVSWLETRKAAGEIKGATYLFYQDVIEKILIPRLGHLKLNEVDAQSVRDLYDQYQQEKRRDRSAFAIKQVLGVALNDAVKQGLIAENPVPKAGIKYSRQNQTKVTLWTDEHVERLVTAIAGEKYECLIRLALMTGMRQGELLGLRWEDLDWKNRVIKIRQAYEKVPQEGKLRYRLGTPKTTSSIRDLKIGEKGMTVLRLQRKRVETLRALVGERWKEHDLVFPSSVGTPINPSNLLSEYKSYLRKAGIPDAPFHYLRHHAASLMARNGANIATVAKVLGHASPTTTQQIYTHYFDREAQKLMAEMGELFGMDEGAISPEE